VSPSPHHRQQARVWFDCVEEMVFGDEDFCFERPIFSNNTNYQSQTAIVQAIQAAYIVCLYQNWEGTDASRRRIRRYRFSNLVSVGIRAHSRIHVTDPVQIVRDTMAGNSESAEYHVTRPDLDFEWKAFVIQEEFIR
jgi:hypothetical protein